MSERTISVPEEVMKRVKKAAGRCGLTPEEFIERAIAWHLPEEVPPQDEMGG